MTDPNTASAAEQVRALYEQAESRAADAFEELVSKPSFGVLLARSAENVAAISRISSDLADLVLRNLRVAGRADVTRLARQLHRTEDKLERLLQEVEELHDELAQALSANGSAVAGPDTEPKRTPEAAERSPAEADALPRRTRGRRGRPAVESPGAEVDTEPKRTRGAS
jgi:HPt (histidine-containing phosphotransfer) domain-containing protein